MCIRDRVVTVRFQTDAAVQIGFRIPEKVKEIFEFDPGQYLTISLTVNGNKVRRAYSICSATHESVISILVKRVEQGLVSNYLNDHIKVGDTIDVLPPNGHFKLSISKAKKHQYYFFGAGSGITPLASMISSLLENEPQTHCYLLYGNRDEDNIIFQKKLDRLQLVYKDRFQLKYLVSQPKKVAAKGPFSFLQSPTIEWQGEIGRVNNKSIGNFLNTTTTPSVDGYFICGPGPMIEATYDGLLELGMEKDLIHREYFSAPISSPDEVASSEERPQISATVKITLDNKAIELTIDDDKNIVQALLDKNIEPPYSCLSGTCSSCMAKLEKGEVAMDVSIGLEDDEKENGYILTCQAHPLTEEVVINYDLEKIG